MDIFIDKFKGIRAVNPLVNVSSKGLMSAIKSQNVELKYSNNGDNIGIYTMKGNLKVAELNGKEICGMWESVQMGKKYWFVYAVDDAQGYLYNYDFNVKNFELIKDGFSPAKLCNGITVAQGFYDHFVFTNGVDDFVAVNMDNETERVKNLNATDAENREIRGLALEYYDGRLVTACKNRVHWSRMGDIFDWSTATTGVVTNPAYQEFDRDVKAIIYYNNSLTVFTLNYSTSFTGNPGDTSSFVRSGAIGGGCAGFQSVVKYDNKLFYYDHLAKNVFAYYLYDVGQTRPTDGYATDVASFFDDIDEERLDEISILGYALDERSEIWLKLPSYKDDTILILDYVKKEWLERNMQNIRSFCIYDGKLYSSYMGKILLEYTSRDFDGEFIPARYEMNIINMGSDSNLKVPKMPIVLTMDSSYANNFYIEFIYDDMPDKSRIRKVSRTNDKYLLWAWVNDDEKGGYWAKSENDELGGIWASDDALNVTYTLTGLLMFKQLQMIIYTQDPGDEFGIKRIEVKRVRFKTKTLG